MILSKAVKIFSALASLALGQASYAQDVAEPGGAGQLLQYSGTVAPTVKPKELGDPADWLQSAASGAERVDLEKAIGSLIDAEKNYAKLALEKGFRAASIQVFADDGVVFGPKPVNGKKYWEKETEDPLLIWQPIFASISRDGELGYTTGPWELKKARDSEQAQGFGQYVTVWRRGNDHSWKVVVDVGVEHSQPKEPPADVETFLPDFPIARPESVREKLQETERTFVNLVAQDAGAAVLAKVGDNVRIFRRGEFPGIGKAAAQLMLGSDHGKEMRTRAGGGMSRSNDLAYNYGEYSNERANITERGIYLAIWQLDLSSEWRLVLDLQKKAPEKNNSRTKATKETKAEAERQKQIFVGNFVNFVSVVRNLESYFDFDVRSARRIKSPIQSGCATPSR